MELALIDAFFQSGCICFERLRFKSKNIELNFENILQRKKNTYMLAIVCLDMGIIVDLFSDRTNQ